jgi:hypothetical protein
MWSYTVIIKCLENTFSLSQAWMLVLIYMKKEKKRRSKDLPPWLKAAPLMEVDRSPPLHATCKEVAGGGAPPPLPF